MLNLLYDTIVVWLLHSGHFGYSPKKHVPLLGNFCTFDRSLKMTIQIRPKIFSFIYFSQSFLLNMPKFPGLTGCCQRESLS